MKKLTWTLAVLLSITLAYSFLQAKDKVSQTTGDFIIIRYNDASPIQVFRGPGIGLEMIKCKELESNCVVELLTKFKSEGFEIVSTTSADISQISSTKSIFVHIFLKRVQ